MKRQPKKLNKDESFRADREIVLVALKQDGNALQYTDEKLRADREIVLAALKTFHYAIQYADKKLMADPEIRFIMEQNKKP